MLGRYPKVVLVSLVLVGIVSFVARTNNVFAEQQRSQSHCIAEALALQDLEAGKVTMPDCFDTYEQAVAAVEAKLQPTDLQPPSIILGVMYEHTNRTGRSVLLYGSTCHNYGFSNMKYWGDFDNIISSLDNGCPRVNLDNETLFRGFFCSLRNGYYSYMGDSCNDMATSILFLSGP